MSKLIELRQKRVQAIADAQKIVLQEKVTTEDRAKFDAMMADVVTYEEDIKRIELVEKLDAESRSTTRPPRPNPDGSAGGVDPEAAAAEKRAFEKYVRKGEKRMTAEDWSALERRDITTSGIGGTVSGAIAIPQQFLTTMIEAKKQIGNVVSIVRQKVTDNNGAPIKIALSNDTGNTLTTLVNEASVVTEQDPSFSGFVMSTDTVATLVKVSRQELDDAYFDLNTWLRDKFGSATIAAWNTCSATAMAPTWLPLFREPRWAQPLPPTQARFYDGLSCLLMARWNRRTLPTENGS